MKVLRAYFDHLRSGKNLVEAYYNTFGKIDMERFEREWRSFVFQIKA